MKLQTAKGVRDLPPEEKIIKNQVVGIIRKTFEKYGFAPLETPTIERFETLAAKFGAGTGSDVLKETFKLSDQGKRKLGLRFEMTTSLARYVAQNPTLKMPFKAYQIGSVFRDGPIKMGREREFWQCDADTIGTTSMLAEAEQIAVLNDVFRELEFSFTIKINNRKVLNGILNQAGIKKRKEALISIDKLDKIGKEGVYSELKERGYNKKQSDAVFNLLNKKFTLNELSKKISDEEGKQGILELKELFSYLKIMGIKDAVFDISLARGQAYYTGTVVEAYMKKNEVTSSIAGGGRYDKMIGGFTDSNREIPAVGVSFGITPVMEVMKIKKAKQDMQKKTPAKVYVIPINTVEQSLKIVQKLREEGVSADFSLGKKGVSKNLQYADSLGIPYAIIIGEKELKSKKVLLRDMDLGTEQMLSIERVIKKLR